MAHGIPDYFKGVDIGYQSLAELIVKHEYDTAQKVNIAIQDLAELIVRPKYGSAQRLLSQETVAASDETTLEEVAGKGMIYDGILWLHYTASQDIGIPRVYVDGTLLSNLSFNALNEYAVWYTGDYVIHTLRFDDTDFYYSVSLSHPVTFETGFKLSYLEKEGGTPEVHYSFIYALIT